MPNCSPKYEPFSFCDLARRCKPLYTVNCAESVRTTSKFVLRPPFIDQSSDQYWFWRGFTAFLVISDYDLAQAVLYNVVSLVSFVSDFPLVQGRSWSRPKHTFKLHHLHVLRPGSLIRNKVQHTAGYLYSVPFGVFISRSIHTHTLSFPCAQINKSMRKVPADKTMLQ